MLLDIMEAFNDMNHPKHQKIVVNENNRETDFK